MSSFTARFHLPLRLHCNRIPGVVCFASASTPIAPSPGERLVETVRSKGGTVDGISVKRWSGVDGGSGFGLCMVRDCPAGTPLITLPPSLQLTYSAATDPRLLALIHRVPAELWGGKLALQLLSHRIVAGPQSPFAAYLEALPIGFPGVPMFFSADELKTLQYPPVTSQITKRCRWLVEFAGQVLDPLRGTPQDPFEGVHVDANALGWALAAVTSRAFRIGGMDRPAALLPLIDMANHDFERANAKITGVGGGSGGVRGNTSGAALCMVATRDVKAGEPVIINYGDLPNDFLLLDYGFIVPDNPYDTVQLRFDPGLIEAAKEFAGVKSAAVRQSLDPEAPTHVPTWQLDALKAFGLIGANIPVNFIQLSAPTAAPGCPVEPRLLAGVRVLCAANESELQGRATLERLGDWNAPLSTRNEIATLRTLTGLAAVAVSPFTTSLEEDVAALRDSVDPGSGAALTEHSRVALRFRLEKKRLLAAAMAAILARLKELHDGGSVGADVAAGQHTSGKKKTSDKPQKLSARGSTGKGFG